MSASESNFKRGRICLGYQNDVLPIQGRRQPSVEGFLILNNREEGESPLLGGGVTRKL
jgi:hypothetical protein